MWGDGEGSSQTHANVDSVMAEPLLLALDLAFQPKVQPWALL